MGSPVIIPLNVHYKPDKYKKVQRKKAALYETSEHTHKLHDLCPGLGNKEQDPVLQELSGGSAVRGPWVCQRKGKGPGALGCFL